MLFHALLLHAGIAGGCRVLRMALLTRLLARLYPRGDGDGAVDARVLWAAAAVVARWPSAGTCLSHALTVQCLLRRRGCDTEVRIGVRRTPDLQVDSHAWLERSGEVIVGGDVRSFAPIWG